MKNLTTKLITAITATALLTCGIAACRPNIIQDPDPKKISDSESKETSEPSQPSDTWIEEPPTTVTDVTLGGWEIPEDPALTADLEQVFNNATEPLKSYFYEPVILLGTQLVSGTNYAFLCKSTMNADKPTADYIITYVYVDLNGNTSLLGDTKVELPGATGDNVTGGWAYSIDATITPEIEDIMAKATETLTGATYEPVAYIGSQVVAGYNHAILCKSAPSVEELGGATNYVLVYVYEDLDGNCEITSTVDIILEV
jgi:hypothetical protein